MTIFEQLITSLIAAAGFAIVFNAPRQTILQCGVIGMSGWILHYLLVLNNMNIVPATVLGAILVGVLSNACAVYYRIPVMIFYVSGIIPLVPGGVAYNAMRSFVEDDYLTGVQLTAKVTLLAGGIAMGLMFSEVANQLLKKVIRPRS